MKKSTTFYPSRLLSHFGIIMVMLLTFVTGVGQNVGVNSTGAAPNSSAGLDVDFPDKGVLIPRVALTGTASFVPMSAHVAGMIVYNTATAGDVTPGFYYNNGLKWISGFPAGTATGTMIYWDGTSWAMVPAGTPGQYLQLNASNIPYWGGGTFATLTTNSATAVTGISATTGGNILSDGGAAVLSRGVCYSVSAGPTIANSTVVAVPPSGIGAYVCNLTGLTPVTSYYVRAYASNFANTTYGDEISFTTTAVLPTLAATTAASAITGNTATSGGNVTSDGGAAIIERGVCYGTTANPTTANSKVIDGSPGVGSFISNLTGLTGYTVYYVRAYAINSVGTAYGTQISFTTLRIPPTVVTVAASGITSTTAISGGSMTWNGGGYSNYQAYGVAYSTVPNAATPTKVATSATNYSYTVPIPPWVTNLTGLALNTTYYIRAYLDVYGTSWVTVYGNELSFTTLPIGTTPVTSITQTTAVSGGSIGTNIPVVSARGVCWSILPNPTIADFSTNDGTTTGTFVSNVTGLTDNTTYYIRAYYTDGAAVTTYGNEYSFTTGVPKVIGDNLAGGKVIYVDATGQHGLIGALVDQGTAVQWGCSGTIVGANGSAIYTGLSNTNKMVAACAAGTAAHLCAAYTAGGTNLPGITNWYLPSKDEFQQLWNQKTLVGLSTGCGTYGCYYWTSTEYNSSIAYCIPSNFVSPNYTLYKTSNQYVRAVRAF